MDFDTKLKLIFFIKICPDNNLIDLLNYIENFNKKPFYLTSENCVILQKKGNKISNENILQQKSIKPVN